MKKLYQLLLDRWNQKTDTVLVTIVEGNGSVPRTTGAYMVVAKKRKNLRNYRRRKPGISGSKKSHGTGRNSCPLCGKF